MGAQRNMAITTIMAPVLNLLRLYTATAKGSLEKTL
jgi:hypothetical protein